MQTIIRPTRSIISAIKSPKTRIHISVITKLILFDGAESMLKRFGINPKNLDLEQFQADYNALLAKKAKLQKTYKSAEKEISDPNRKLSNIREYLGQEQTPEQSTDKKPEQSL